MVLSIFAEKLNKAGINVADIRLNAIAEELLARNGWKPERCLAAFRRQIEHEPDHQLRLDMINALYLSRLESIKQEREPPILDKNFAAAGQECHVDDYNEVASGGESNVEGEANKTPPPDHQCGASSSTQVTSQELLHYRDAEGKFVPGSIAAAAKAKGKQPRPGEPASPEAMERAEKGLMDTYKLPDGRVIGDIS